MKPVIAIDDWKLAVFTKGLEDAGFSFKKSPGLTPDMILLSLEIPKEKLGDLMLVVKQCQIRAAELNN